MGQHSSRPQSDQRDAGDLHVQQPRGSLLPPSSSQVARRRSILGRRNPPDSLHSISNHAGLLDDAAPLDANRRPLSSLLATSRIQQEREEDMRVAERDGVSSTYHETRPVSSQEGHDARDTDLNDVVTSSLPRRSGFRHLPSSTSLRDLWRNRFQHHDEPPRVATMQTSTLATRLQSNVAVDGGPSPMRPTRLSRLYSRRHSIFGSDDRLLQANTMTARQRISGPIQFSNLSTSALPSNRNSTHMDPESSDNLARPNVRRNSVMSSTNSGYNGNQSLATPLEDSPFEHLLPDIGATIHRTPPPPQQPLRRSTSLISHLSPSRTRMVRRRFNVYNGDPSTLPEPYMRTSPPEFTPNPMITSSPWPDHTHYLHQNGSPIGGELGTAPDPPTDQAGSLPRILSLAAHAIASRFSDTQDESPLNLGAGPGDLEGSLQNLFSVLQRSTMHERDRPGEEASSQTGNGETTSSMNFLRVYRVANGPSTLGQGSQRPSVHDDSDTRPRAEGENTNQQANEDGDRSVTLVVVGMTTETHRDGQMENGIRTLLDLSLRGTPTPSEPRMRRWQSATRPTRHSITRQPRSSGSSPSRSDSYSSRFSRNRNVSFSASPSTIIPNAGIATAPTFADSPPGPYPPPSTPADASLSAYSSGATTPNRRPTSASAAHPIPFTTSLNPTPEQLNRDYEAVMGTERVVPRTRHRRRSESEFARQRAGLLGAGAARRNGVLLQEHPEGNSPTIVRNSRSWYIYVVGTNLTEDHPALTAPSLFTDDPSYEDMLLLSSLLGPVKPPVATRADIDSARGLYTVHNNGGMLQAHGNGSDSLHLGTDEQCLVCLDGYEQGEELRQLQKCSHHFHRQCIDEWLTTGKNSCPLCRSQGVDEAATT